jgi:hypothetical protein
LVAGSWQRLGRGIGNYIGWTKGVVKIIGENFAMKDSWRCWQADHSGERLPIVDTNGFWSAMTRNCLYLNWACDSFSEEQARKPP